MKPHAVQDVVAYVMDRLANGLYSPGSRLPTSRELATELGVHRNTVAKAYKSLVELGLVSSTPGRGTFASARVDLDNRNLHSRQISERLAEDILRAKRGRIDESDLRRTIDELIASIYHAPPPRGSFVECNTDDLRVAVAEIEQQSNVRLAPVLLADLATDPASVAAEYDVIFTSLFHLLEIRELLVGLKPRHRIIGIHTQPDERALSEIAQIAPGARVGAVVSDIDGARRFNAQIRTFSEKNVQTIVRPTDDEIRELAERVDVIVASRSRAVQIRRLNLTVPMIELAFHISWESARRVVDALYSTPEAGQVDGLELVADAG